ncbi:MAG: hypothetical protein MJ228_05445 [Bacilli bacterium]|nr:hypothetical protein [Bacilli bacterium]
MEISFYDIKKVKDATGAKLLDCKSALETTNGDVEFAIALIKEQQEETGAPAPFVSAPVVQEVKPAAPSYEEPTYVQSEEENEEAARREYAKKNADREVRDKYLKTFKVAFVILTVIDIVFVVVFALLIAMINALTGDIMPMEAMLALYGVMGVSALLLLFAPFLQNSINKKRLKKIDEVYNITGYPYDEVMRSFLFSGRSIQRALNNLGYNGDPSVDFRDRVSELYGNAPASTGSYGSTSSYSSQSSYKAPKTSSSTYSSSSYSSGEKKGNKGGRVVAAIVVILLALVGGVAALDLTGVTNIAISEPVNVYREIRKEIIKNEEEDGSTNLSFQQAEFVYVAKDADNTYFVDTYIFKIKYVGELFGMKATVTTYATYKKSNKEIDGGKYVQSVYDNYYSQISKSSYKVSGKKGSIMFTWIF